MDVQVPAAITRALLLRGVDVLTAQFDGTTRLADPDLLDRAAELGRVLFSQDEDLLAEGKSSGNGVVRVTRAEPTKGIWYDLDFEHGTQLFHGSIRFEPTAGGLQVTCAIETDMGANPLQQWAGLILDKLMGGDMATGLTNLKEQFEAAK